MKIDLIIKNDSGQWVSLDIIDPDIVMTKAFQDLEDPASINAAYTINCSLPFTEHNNEVLGALYNLDYENLGTTTFNQKKRYECHLLHNQENIYEGYFVLDSTEISEDISKCKYNATIYDEMYNLFKKMDYTLADPADSFDSSLSKKVNINAIDTNLTPDLVTTSFKSPLQYNDIFSYDILSNNEYKIKSMTTTNEICETFGWLPTYRNADNLEYDRVGVFNSGGTDVESGWSQVEYTFDELSNTLPHNKYPECSQMVWKTYNCKPYIWYSSYLQFLFAEIYRSTGYKTDLRTNFFNPNNPYYANLIRTLKYPTMNRDELSGGWKTISTASTDFNTVAKTVNADTYQPVSRTIEDLAGSTTLVSIDPTTLDNRKRYRIKMTAYATILNQMRGSAAWTNVDARINKYCAANATFRFNMGNSVVTKSNSYDFCHSDSYNVVKRNHPNAIELGRTKQSFGYQRYINQDSYIGFPNTYSNYWYFDRNGDLKAGMNVNGGITGMDNYKPEAIQIKIEHDIDKSEITALKNGSVSTLKWAVDFSYNRYTSANFVAEPQSHFDYTSLYLRDVVLEFQELEEPKVTFTDMLGEDFNILEHFTEFIKQFNLICDVDYVDKKIYCYERGEYFNENRDGRTSWYDKVEDWSKYINIQDTLEHTAIISDYKNIKYGYEDRDTTNNAISRDETGDNANTKDFDLNMPCNTEELNYLEGLNNSYIGRVKSNWLYDAIIGKVYTPHLDSLTPYLYIDCDDQGQPLEDVEGQLLFREVTNYMPTDYQQNGNNRNAVVASDTSWEIDNNTYLVPYMNNAPTWYNFVSESDELPKVSTYKPFDKQLNSQYIGTIQLSEWTDKLGNTTDPNVNGIYETWFKAWNELLYNYPEYQMMNYKMTAEFHLPLDVYKNFDFSHLILIDNTLWMVLSIDEYCYGNETAKITMIQIKGNANFDIDPKFDIEYLLISPQYISLPEAPTVPNTFTYKVFCSDLTNLQETVYTTSYPSMPNWIATFQKISEVVVTGAGYKLITIQYTTNSNYPQNTKDSYKQCAYYAISGTSTEDYAYISNEPYNNQEIDDGIAVTPTLSVIPNDTNANSIAYKVTTVYPFDYATTSGSVITNAQFTMTAHISNSNDYYVTMTFHDTTGQCGDNQLIAFYNTAGKSCTASVIRDYDHQESVIPDDNGDDKLFLFDYTTVSDPLYSRFDFTIRTNYAYLLDKWTTSLYDAVLSEDPYDKSTAAIELYDITDPNNVSQLSEDGTAQYAANTVNKFSFWYPRRHTVNNSSFAGFFTLQCVDVHPTSYTKKINVFAGTLNDNNSDTHP